jgi:uncharacterized protein
MLLALALLLSAELMLPSPPTRTCVLDEASLLGADDAKDLLLACRRNWRGRSVQVAVLLTRDLRGRSLKDFTTDVFNHWGLGSRERDDGVLIVFHAGPQRSRVRVGIGRGLEGILTDDVLVPMMRRHTPSERDAKPGPGLRALAEGVGIAVLEAVQEGRLDAYAAAKRTAQDHG